MSDFIFVVHTNAVPGREDEYNDWYTNQHLSDVVAVDGVISAQRFERRTDGEATDAPNFTHKYLAVYEMEGDPDVVIPAIRASGMYISDAMERDTAAFVYYPTTAKLE